jgi:transposase
MGTITLNEKQRRRCEIITRLIANRISSSEASELLGRSSRQVRRIRQRYEAQGLQILVHGNQGRPSPRPPTDVNRCAMSCALREVRSN